MLPPKLLQQLASLSDAEGGVLGNIVVTATLEPATGALGKVAGVKDKLKTAIKDVRVPRIKAFAVSTEQADVLNEPGIEDHKSETASPRLLVSDGFNDLVVKLASLRHSRDGVKPYDYRRVLGIYRHIDFVGREWLFERIANILEDKQKDGGFIVLTAGPGFGKTAFVLELTDRYKDTGIGTTALGAWHILRKTQSAWTPAKAMVEQLEWRLRDRLACPLGKDDSKDKVNDENAARILQTAMTGAARKLGPEQRLLLVIDGIDEAFGINSAAGPEQLDLLRRMFPPSGLPKGVFVLFTSRPGAHLLGWLNDKADVIDVDHGDASLLDANRADLYTYLERKLKDVASPGGHDPLQNLIPALAERMTDACEGGFYVAEWFARKAEDLGRLERWLAGEVLPRGIDETLLDDWNYKPTGLDRTEKALLPVLATAIAIWHEAGTRVTQDVIVELFEAASNATLVNGRTLAVGRMSARQIEREGVEVCLDKLRDWFDGAAAGQEPVYTYRHSRIPELILEKIVDARTQREVHRLLGWTSAKWQDLRGESRRVALANVPWHHVLAKNLDAAMQLLADPCDPYLATVYAELDTAVPVLARNYAVAIQLAATQEPDKRSVVKSKEPAPLMHLRDIWRVLSQYGESLRKPECPLAPTLYNHLAAAWDPNSEAHRNLVQAAEDYQGVWLQCMNPEPPDRRLIAVLWGNSDSVISLKWSPDGTRLSSCSHDGTLCLWDGEIGTLIGRPMILAIRNPQNLDWSPDGKRLAGYSMDGAHLMDGANGKALCEPLSGSGGLESCFAWSPDGARLAFGSQVGSLRLHDGLTGALLSGAIVGHTGDVTALAWSPDGTRLASLSKDSCLRLWDGQNGKALQNPQPGRLSLSPVTSIVWSPDGTRLGAKVSYEDNFKFWNGNTGEPFGGHLPDLGGVSLVAWSPDGARLASSTSGSVSLWDEQASVHMSGPVKGHRGSVSRLVWSPDGSKLASVVYDEGVRLWQGQLGTLIGEEVSHSHLTNLVAWSPDSMRLATTSSLYGFICLWDMAAIVPLGTPPSEDFVDTCFAWSRDGKRLACSTADGGVRLWEGGEEPWAPDGELMQTNSSLVSYLAWSPDGKCIASGAFDGSVHLWDIQTGARLTGAHNGHIELANCLAWSLDSVRLASGSYDGSVLLWDIERTRAPILELKTGKSALVCSLAWSPDGMRLASGSDDGSVHIWDIHTRTLLGESQHADKWWVICLAWSPDGKRLAYGSAEDSVRFLDGQTGEPVVGVLFGTRTEGVDIDKMMSIVWSSDSKRLACSHSDGYLRLWDIEAAVSLAEVDIQMTASCLRMECDRLFALGMQGGRPRVVRYLLRQSVVDEP